MSRPAPSVARQAPAPQQRPQFSRPQQSAPHVATPRSAPSIQRQETRRQEIQRQAPPSRNAARIERREQAIQQRQQAIQQRQQSVQSKTSAPNTVTSNAQSPRVQQLESKRRLSRSERRELGQLRQTERRNAQQNPSADQQKAALSGNNTQRLQQLEGKRRLTRSERRELGQLRRDERQNAQQNPNVRQSAVTNNTGNQQRIQALQSKGRLTRSERRELGRLQREDRQNARIQQQQNPQAAAQAQQRQRTPRAQVTAQQASQGRFASNLANNQNGRRAGRRAARLASQVAWQLGVLAPYVPWRGPVYWPYAYNDMFYYTFWPDAYDSGYWAYAYDDLYDGVFFPDGAPYAEYTAEGPYDSSYARYSGTTGTAAPRGGGSVAPGRVNQATREFCADQASGVTAWPLDKIANAVQPSDDQNKLLEDLRKASQEAAAQFKDACPDSVPLTPPGRLQAMTQRLQATSDAVTTVKPALDAFYNSLSNEQKARFNELGPALGKSQRPQRNAANAEQQPAANCSSEKAGLSSLAINRIEDVVQPTDAQEATLDRLDSAIQKSVEILSNACPNTVAMTPVGRLEAMKQRLDAMIAAATAVRPALEDFYAALTDEQKAKFNRLGRQTAQQGG